MDNSSSFRALLVFAMMAGAPATSAFAQSRPLPNAPASEILLPEPPNQPYPSTFRPSFQWNYVCPRQSGAGCSMSCPPNAAIGSVAAAQVWLGASDLGNAPVPAIYYYLVYYTGTEKMVGAGFVQSTRNLSCQALAMRITYSGPPK
jgi:hypothetical protein